MLRSEAREGEPGMHVTYELTADDLRRFARYCLFHRPRIFLSALIASFGIGVLITGILALFVGGWPLTVPWWFFPVNIAITVLNLWKTRYGITQALKEIPGLLGDAAMRISPDGINQHSPLTEEHSLWPRVQRIVATEDAHYLFTEPVRASIIPRRAFTTPAEASAFINLAQTSWQAARGNETGTAANLSALDRKHVT